MSDEKILEDAVPKPETVRFPEDRMLKWFKYDHLPGPLQTVSSPFHKLAHDLVEVIEPGPERTVALRKLLESKDAAVRAFVYPYG